MPVVCQAPARRLGHKGKTGPLPFRGAVQGDKQTRSWVVTIVSAVINIQNMEGSQKRGTLPHRVSRRAPGKTETMLMKLCNSLGWSGQGRGWSGFLN